MLIENKANIERDYRNGMPLKELADKYSCTYNYLSVIVREWNLEREDNTGLLSEEIQKRIVEDYIVNIETLENVRRKYNVGAVTIRKVLEKYGYKMRTANETRMLRIEEGITTSINEMKDEIIKDYENGMLLKELEQKYGYVSKYIYEKLVDWNVQKKRSKIHLTEDQKEYIAKRYSEATDTTATLANKFRVSYTTIVKVLKEKGIKVRSHGETRRLRKAKGLN